jgi:CBS domain-containing protein
MKTVREVLQGKPAGVCSVAPQAMAFEALQLMADKDVGAVVVVQKGKPVGMFSERDYARKVILKGKSSKETRVSDLMTKPVLYVRPEQTVADCMALMTDKRVRHLPVMENDKLTGIVSIGDVVKAIIAEQEFTIRELENYITGAG